MLSVRYSGQYAGLPSVKIIIRCGRLFFIQVKIKYEIGVAKNLIRM